MSLKLRGLIILALFLMHTNQLYSQSDTEFWFAAPDLQTAHGDRPVLLRISAGAQPATVSISIPANPSAGVQNVTVNANSSVSVDLTSQINLIENGTPNTVMQKGLYITSTARVSIYYDVNHNYNGDLYALKGRNALGNVFTVPMQTEFNNRAISAGATYTADVIILATEDGTRVDVTCKNPLSGQPSTFSINLQRGETYVLTAPGNIGNQKPGGTILRSNKPISVSTKDDSILLPGQNCADTAGDQLIPDFMAGTEYIVTKGYLNISPDSYYVFATRDSTTIKVNGTVVATLLKQGDHYIGRLTDPSCYLESDKPVQVFHITGIGCEVGGAVIPSVKCTGSTQVNVTRASATQTFNMNVLAPTSITGDFTINGSNTLLTSTSFAAVPGTNGKWSVARITIPVNVAGTGEPVVVDNPTGKFHVGVIQGTQVNTARYGYFSDFSLNSIDFQVPGRPDIDVTNGWIICYKTTARLKALNVDASTWSWVGPNQFSSTDTLLNIPAFDTRDTGIYTVTITANGCGTASKDVRLLIDKPIAIPELSTNGCENDSVRFFNRTTGMTRAIWNFGAGGTMDTAATATPRVKLNRAGDLEVKLKVKSPLGCFSDDSTLRFTLSSIPQARYDVPAVTCVNKVLTFNNRSTITTGSIVKWHWDLDDGNGFRTMTAPTPQQSSYNVHGYPKIRLVAESQTGCLSDTFRLASFYVTPYPKPGFIVPEVCLDDASAVFTDTTSSPDGFNGFTYRWDFNAGTPPITMGPLVPTSEVTARNPAVKYRKSDDYRVKLIVDAHGCTDSVTMPFTVNGANPVPGFDILRPDTLCANDSVRIRNLSTVDFGVVTRLEIFWDANDSSLKTIDEMPYVGKTYAWRYKDFQSPSAKNLVVTLRAYSGDASSCSRAVTRTISLNASPRVSFSVMPGICLDANPRRITEASFDPLVAATTSFSGKGVDPDGLFHPNLGDTGTHTIKYLAVSGKGCRDSAYRTITVWPLPKAAFSVNSPLCEKNAVTFTDRSVANAGTLDRWIWDHGDSTKIDTMTNGNAHTHTFAAWGNPLVRLRVRADNGCSSPVKDTTLRMNPLPRPAFQLPKACLPEARATFTNNTTIPDSSDASLTWRWSFGDVTQPAISTSKDGQHTYYTKGSYPVKLIVTSAAGCRDSLSQTFSDVFDQPKAGFSGVDSGCTDLDILFTDTSRAGTGSVTERFWDLGDGNRSNNTTFTHAWRNAGAYRVTLFVNTSIGCRSDTAVRTVNVYEYPKISAGPDLFVLDDGQKRMEATATGTITGFRWSPPDFLNDSTILKPMIIRPQEDRIYTLTVTGRGNCVSKDDLQMTVLRLPTPPNTFTPNGDGYNDVWDIRYLNQYPDCVVEVFSTSGQLLFRTIGYQTPWDGTYKGQPQPAGTYFYVVDPRNGRKKMAGYITILR